MAQLGRPAPDVGVRDLQLLGGNIDGSQGSSGSYASAPASSSSSGSNYSSIPADDLPF